MLKNLVIHIFITVVLVEVQSKICRKQVISTYLVADKFSFTTQHEGHWQWQIKTRTRYAGKVHNITFCCNERTSIDVDTEVISEAACNPLCKSNCTNGYCKELGQCTCNAGYNKRNDTCVPLCEGDCLHGTCVAPNTCRCDSGFVLVNGTCQPIAQLNRINTHNNSSSSLRCHPGYIQSENSCIPYCVNGCPPNKHCVAPDTCFCDMGWRDAKNDRGEYTCVPECSAPCGWRGTCVYPDTCRCFPGYQVNYYRQLQIGNAYGPVCTNLVRPIWEVVKSPLSYEVRNRTTPRINHPYETTSAYNHFNETNTTTVSYLNSTESRTTVSYLNSTENLNTTTAIVKHLVNGTDVGYKNSNRMQEVATKIPGTQNGMSILISIIIGKSYCGNNNTLFSDGQNNN